jgi:hypothetical protein
MGCGIESVSQNLHKPDWNIEEKMVLWKPFKIEKSLKRDQRGIFRHFCFRVNK